MDEQKEEYPVSNLEKQLDLTLKLKLLQLQKKKEYTLKPQKPKELINPDEPRDSEEPLKLKIELFKLENKLEKKMIKCLSMPFDEATESALKHIQSLENKRMHIILNIKKIKREEIWKYNEYVIEKYCKQISKRCSDEECEKFSKIVSRLYLKFFNNNYGITWSKSKGNIFCYYLKDQTTLTSLYFLQKRCTFNTEEVIKLLNFQANYDGLYFMLNDALVKSQFILECLSTETTKTLNYTNSTILSFLDDFDSRLLAKALLFEIYKTHIIIQNLFNLSSLISVNFNKKLEKIRYIVEQVAIIAKRITNNEPIPEGKTKKQFLCFSHCNYIIKRFAIKKYLKKLYPNF